jgi:hypothetical protein
VTENGNPPFEFPQLFIFVFVALLAIAIGGERSGANGMAESAGGVGRLGNAVIGFLVVDGLARLREELGVTGLAFSIYAGDVLGMCERHVAILGFKKDCFGRNSRGQRLGFSDRRRGRRGGLFGLRSFGAGRQEQRPQGQ